LSNIQNIAVKFQPENDKFDILSNKY